MKRGHFLPLTLLIASVAGVKIGLQWTVPGFLQGDDVETMEAAFRAAFGLVYDDWEIRSHLLSEGIVAPLLRAASLVPGITTDGLLLAGSLPFVLAGALATLLVFRLAIRWGLDEGEAVVAATLYAVHALTVAYGIGGFPRVMVAPLIVGAALLASVRGASLSLIAAGLLIGLAGAARYSEWLFLLPLLVGVARSSRDAILVLLGFVAGVGVVGGYDAITGDGAFSSLVAFARYTVSGASSSAQAAQPPWWYLARLHQWLPLTAIPLLSWGWRRSRSNALAWIAMPIVVLSFVHHKELRYLQNVIPFVAIAIASGSSAERDARRSASGVLRLVLLALTVVWAAWGVNRLDRRSSSAVAAARAIAAERPAAVAFAQAWAYGNHLYVRPALVIDLPVAPSAVDLDRARDAAFVALYTSTVTPDLRARLEALGYVPWQGMREGGRAVVVWRLPPP